MPTDLLKRVRHHRGSATELLGVGCAYLTPLCLSLPLVHPVVTLQPLLQQELTRLCMLCIMMRATSLTTCLYARHYNV